MLMKMIYCSRANDGVDMDEFKKILATAQKNNAERGLTGLLIFNSKIFLQVLEGTPKAINRLYTTLAQDPRHHDLFILKYQEIEQRNWAQWSMSFAPATAANRSLYLKYSPVPRFDPYSMTGDAAEQLMLELTGNTLTLEKESASPTDSPEKGVLARLFGS